MKRLSLFLAIILTLSITGPAFAAKNAYAISLNSVLDGKATFTVTRSFPDDNDPVVWVATKCSNAPDGALPVLWGLWDSVIGVTNPIEVAGSCVAWVTVQPWTGMKKNNSHIEFEAVTQ